jgi:hypothetical protein
MKVNRVNPQEMPYEGHPQSEDCGKLEETNKYNQYICIDHNSHIGLIQSQKINVICLNFRKSSPLENDPNKKIDQG